MPELVDQAGDVDEVDDGGDHAVGVPAPAVTTPGRVVDLSDEFGAQAGTWQLGETEPGSGSWIVRWDGVRVGVVRREATSRGRRAWMARPETGVPLPASGDLAVAVGSSLWRSRDLAAAGVARHLIQQQRRPRRRR